MGQKLIAEPHDVLRIEFACGTVAEMPVTAAIAMLVDREDRRAKLMRLRDLLDDICQIGNADEREAREIVDALLGDTE